MSHGELGNDAESEALVLVGYAATMQAVQRFEFALKAVAIDRTDLPDGIGWDEAWRRVEKILNQPAGRLAGSLASDLGARFRQLRRNRNKLAHEALTLWRLERDLGLVTDLHVAESLADIEGEFDAFAEELEELSAQHLRDLGVTDEELARLDPELRALFSLRAAGPES